MSWSVGPPAVLAVGLTMLLGQRWHAVAGILAFVALPYSSVWGMLPWRRLHRWMMAHCLTSCAFAATSFHEDPTYPPNFEDALHRPLLLAYSPHGVFCHAFSGSHGVLHPGLAEKGVLFLLAGPLFHAPVFRHLVVALGNSRSAAKASVVQCMRQRKHLALLPGGLEEASLAQPGHEAVFVRTRLGFIKLALQHGYTVHPVYSFGEASCYACGVPAWVPHSWRWALARRGVPVVAPIGRWWAPLMPRRGAELHTYVGRPVRLKPLITTYLSVCSFPLLLNLS